MKLMIPTPVPIHCNDNDEFLDQDNSEIAVKLFLLMIKWYVRVKILKIVIISGFSSSVLYY